MAGSLLVRTAARLATLVMLAMALLSPGIASAHASGGAVLPPNARPFNYSLTDLTKHLALFTTSGNDPAYYPDTPFQVLYFDPAGVQIDTSGSGWAFSGANRFTVDSGTHLFVPLQNADDSPPILGVFPTTTTQAKKYFFDAAQLGARGYQVVVDGASTAIGPQYLAGPVKTQPLLDGGGTHMITLGVILAPLLPGRHTVIIRGGLYGDLLPPAYGIAYLTEDFVYTVNVRPHGSR